MPQRYVVSAYTIVSWREGELQIASPVSATTFTTSDPSALHVLSAFAVPRAIEDVASQEAALIAEWIAAAILVDADAPEAAAVHHWDREALALQASSRARGWRKTPGRTTPAIAPRHSDAIIPLAPGPASSKRDLATLLDARRSRRVWAGKPIDVQLFSELFWLSARNRDGAPEGRVSRPYPSGGGAYSLELYPVLGAGAVETLAGGVYRYLPDAHALEIIAPVCPESQRIRQAAGNTAVTDPPPVAIVITSRYARQSEEYGRLAYTLVLKEVGCLFQTLYLAAESLGLAACALGRGTPPGMLARLCGTTELEEPVVGEFAIGAAAD